MIQFSVEDLYKIIRDELSHQWIKWTKIHEMFEFEDLVQEAILWYYQPMRSTGETRIDHYRKTCDSPQHLKNLIRLSLSQFIPGMFRLQSVSNHPYSLDVPLQSKHDGTSSDEAGTTALDLIPDTRPLPLEVSETNAIFTILDSDERALVEDLVNTGYLEQLTELTDAGYSQRSITRKLKQIDLSIKYQNYEILIQNIQSKVYNYYKEAKDDLTGYFEPKKDVV